MSGLPSPPPSPSPYQVVRWVPSPLSRHFSHCVAKLSMHMCAELGKFCLCEWAHLSDKTVLTALIEPTKLVVKSSTNPSASTLAPTVQKLEHITHAPSKQIPLCSALTVGGNAKVYLTVWLSVSLSVWTVDMQLHKYPQQEQQLHFWLIFRALCRHIFGGSRSPFCTAPRPFVVCFLLFLFFMCSVCLSTAVSGSHVLTTSQNTRTNLPPSLSYPTRW